jgi:D-alanyl-D-alanine carboxypeptidase
MFKIFFIGLFISLNAFSQNSQCRIKDITLGFLDGSDSIFWNSLVSKKATEHLSPLAIPLKLVQIPSEYLNPDNQSYYADHGLFEALNEDAAASAISLVRKAMDANIQLYIHSGYRSYDVQCDVFKGKVITEMKTKNLDLPAAITSVNTRSAQPGESEHQLGAAVDFVTDIPGIGHKLEFEFSQTAAYKWLQQNAGQFGYVLSYPLADGIKFSDPHPRTKIIFEPWHWRYLGTYYAKVFKQCESKMTLQEFLREINVNNQFSCK